MKIKDIRSLSGKELQKKLDSFQKKLLTLRLHRGGLRQQDAHKLPSYRKAVARIKTVLGENSV